MDNKKAFSQEAYDENDERAKKESVKFVHNRLGNKWDRISEGEQFKRRDVRFLHSESKEIMDIEAEVKQCWTGQYSWMGYDTFHVPHRKADSKADQYICFNDFMNIAMFIPMETVLASGKTEKDTKDKYGRDLTTGEPFFDIPINDCKFYKKDSNGNFKKINRFGSPLE